LLSHGLTELAQNVADAAQAAGLLRLRRLLGLAGAADEVLEKASCVEHGR
jgi:hypothetical protein